MSAIINLSTNQHLAIDLCTNLTQRIVGITGEAGTGKTVLLGEAAQQLTAQGYKVALCAPTGRAASRIQEATKLKAKTVHRLLRWGMPDPDDDDDPGLPAHSKQNPMDHDVIFVDEASMVSDELYRSLISAMKRGSSIRFFGDANQLPPINSISPFLNILKKWESVTLTDNFRSSSGIIQAAHKLLKGIVPTVNEQFNLLHVPAGAGLSILDAFVDQSFRTPDCQIISPTRIGKLGTSVLNRYIQNKLNPKGYSITLEYDYGPGIGTKSTKFKAGDKILWTKNDYKLNLYNGMIGYIVAIEDENGSIVVNFNGKDQIIPPTLESTNAVGDAIFQYDPRKSLDLAYAITTHKSQGSEFDKLIMLLFRCRVLNQANFYTAITRARVHATCLALPGGLKSAMQKGKTE